MIIPDKLLHVQKGFQVKIPNPNFILKLDINLRESFETEPCLITLSIYSTVLFIYSYVMK